MLLKVDHSNSPQWRILNISLWLTVRTFSGLYSPREWTDMPVAPFLFALIWYCSTFYVCPEGKECWTTAGRSTSMMNCSFNSYPCLTKEMIDNFARILRLERPTPYTSFRSVNVSSHDLVICTMNAYCVWSTFGWNIISLHTFTGTTYISFFIQFAPSKDLFPGGHVASSVFSSVKCPII